jgi:hypothetical protein
MSDMTEPEIQAAQQGAPPTATQTSAPPPVTVTESDALQFVYDGRGRLTALAVAIRNLAEWAGVFEQRGGTPIYGDDALAMVYLYNELEAEFLSPENRATIARLRTDI